MFFFLTKKLTFFSHKLIDRKFSVYFELFLLQMKEKKSFINNNCLIIGKSIELKGRQGMQ